MSTGWGIDRYGRAYFGTNGLQIPVSTLILSDELYDALAGNTQEPFEYFADVQVGGVALPHVESISIDRAIDRKSGLCTIIFHTASAVVQGVSANAEVSVSAGLRQNGAVAWQTVFRGRLDQYVAPDLGKTEARIEAFDIGRILDTEAPGSKITGDVAAWLQAKVEALGILGLQVVTRGSSPILDRELSLNAYRTILDAARIMASGDIWRYVFAVGNGSIIVLDPASLATQSPLFTLTRALKAQPVTDASTRYNKVPYSNYVGYAADQVAYLVTVNPDGSSTIQTSGSSSAPLISGIYEDVADQAVYGVLESNSLLSPVPTSKEAFEGLAASFVTESRRSRIDFETAFNPFFDLGDVCEYDNNRYFAARVRHTIKAGRFWGSAWELRSAA